MIKSKPDQISRQGADTKLKQLQAVLQGIGESVIAVSGGIDSTLLALIAGRLDCSNVSMIHAVSPAVPENATCRVKRYASKENWKLKLCDVGEFRDESYLKNPINRCFYCKSNLYRYISTIVDSKILSGTNCDDLNDYRPGLKAATKYNVRHPYLEADIDKSSIRSIARMLGLSDLSELPASPCLSSRVETGIPIDGAWLKAVDGVETEIHRMLGSGAIRCRIRRDGIFVELDYDMLSKLDIAQRQKISSVIQNKFPVGARNLQVHYQEYRMGSAFVLE